MKFSNSIWCSTFAPSLACGGLAAGCAYFALGSVAASAFVLAACVAGAGLTAAMISRNARDASAQLRHPELRGSSARTTGVFNQLAQEALERIEQLEGESIEATRGRADSETRSQARQRRIRLCERTLDAIDYPLVISDPHGQVEFSNSAAIELFATSAEGTSDSLPDFTAVPILKELLEQTQSRSAASDRRSTEMELERRGEKLTYRATAVNIYSEEAHSQLGVAVTLNDIRQERIENTRHAEFVSSACHELKTPMAGIRAYTELLLDGDVDDVTEQHKLFGFIDQQIERMTTVVNNMLNLARIESGVVRVQREDCELNDVLKKAIDVVHPTAVEKGVVVVSELSELYLPAHVDGDLFCQAIINLLSNAVKYTPAGGEVHLKSRMEESRAIIDVEDTGIGIPEESLPNIFERFYRVPENKHVATGTGLGLPLVQYIVTELHNGTIDVTSDVGEGSSFSISIPLGHRDGLMLNQEKPVCAV